MFTIFSLNITVPQKKIHKRVSVPLGRGYILQNKASCFLYNKSCQTQRQMFFTRDILVKSGYTAFLVNLSITQRITLSGNVLAGKAFFSTIVL